MKMPILIMIMIADIIILYIVYTGQNRKYESVLDEINELIPSILTKFKSDDELKNYLEFYLDSKIPKKFTVKVKDAGASYIIKIYYDNLYNHLHLQK